MREQPASILAQIGTTLLSSYKVLALLRRTPFHHPLNLRDLREATYLGYLPWSARLPDHVFEHSWQLLVQQNRNSTGLLIGVLQAIGDEFFEQRHSELHIKQQKFAAWQQSIVSRISGLPLLVGAQLSEQLHARLANEMHMQWPWEPPQRRAGKNLPVVSPYDPLVEDYLRREGLHETHLHLNGSTHAENCWLRALRMPKQETKDFSLKWNIPSSPDAVAVRELARSINPDLSPTELHRQLVAAGRLRKWLVAAATDTLKPEVQFPHDLSALMDEESLQEEIPYPMSRYLQLSAQSCTADELYWMQQLLRRLKNRYSATLERMFHTYLILQNQYYRLLVQSEEQFGFDQFQKFTYNKLRDPAEEDYFPRFLAMHGTTENISRTTYLEGRISPKDTLRKNHQLFKAVLDGYWCYLNNQDPRSRNIDSTPRKLGEVLVRLEEHFRKTSPLDRSHHRLALVVHFIKKSWTPGRKAGPYRFYKQRQELELTANVLLECLTRWPRLRTWVRGIDAAANELHAPPEIFSSCYRVCQQAGLTHRTYHAGEDFAHLLSGLRTIYEALELLDLRNGDRIGHGTAMGILPKLWLERMPGQLVVKKGEWMLDLLAAWRLLRTVPSAVATAARVADDLAKCAGEVFRREISCTSLEAAMKLRHLNIRFVQAALETDWSVGITPLSDLWQSEAQRVLDAKHSSPEHLKLLWEWLSDQDLWERSETLQSVDAAYFDETTYLHLQQALMREVSHRNVIIETLPSSNVRISQYNSFSEHHSLRWMRAPGFVQEGDPEIMVSLGSDDPGVFAGDLNGEFYQLYGALRNQGISDRTALELLAPINERGRAYRFHDPFLG
ncbi:hypothetical protein GPJ81_11325 [Pseudomonas alkylphenolica]|uniref:Adenosine deaminase n=2 Tax=Pseudomonas alkylphenolica TaxID=237609 RepID=A0A6I6H747_9PSED|nr:hypothetical protein GPJ81_11325 [Pseudomonas alkylphenolica]